MLETLSDASPEDGSSNSNNVATESVDTSSVTGEEDVSTSGVPKVLPHEPDNVKVPARKKTTPTRCYEYFLEGQSKQQISTKTGIRFKSIERYINSSYQSSGAGLLRDRLGLTNQIVEDTLSTQQALKALGDKHPKGEDYDRIIFKSLGSDCTDCVVAKWIFSKLHRDLNDL